MNSKKRNLKAGNESGVIIAILAVLLILVAAIVGAVVLKDNGAIATFDGGKVTKKEYQVYYELYATYLTYYGYDTDEIPAEILEKAAYDKIILTDAEEAGITISDEDKAEVDEYFSNEDYIEYFTTYYSFSIDSLKELYYNDYIIADYLELLGEQASDDEIEEYIRSQYDDDEEVDMYEYDTSHILFSFTDDDGNTLSDEDLETLKTEAEEVLARALAGEDFATLASEYSDDTATAENGGQYVMYMDGNTVDEYADVVATLEEGEVYYELVESSYGYHIIKLNAKTENGRLNNSTEREDYAYTLYDTATTDRNLTYDEDELIKFVKSIDSTYTTSDEEEEDDTTTTE